MRGMVRRAEGAMPSLFLSKKDRRGITGDNVSERSITEGVISL